MIDSRPNASSCLEVDVQYALNTGNAEAAEPEEPPSREQLITWAEDAYSRVSDLQSELTIRLVGSEEMTELNHQYRGNNKPTNVLSFRYELDPDIELSLLGDVVICHDIIVQEAHQQNKLVMDHYAHMVTHGVLHLCGYDHQDDTQAEHMESLEVSILAANGISNPYN